MPFQKGNTHSKGKGRPKGSGPRPVIDVVQALLDNNFDLIQEIIIELRDPETEKSVKLRTMMGLLEYCVPKKRAVEVTEVDKKDTDIVVTKENVQELYEVARLA